MARHKDQKKRSISTGKIKELPRLFVFLLILVFFTLLQFFLDKTLKTPWAEVLISFSFLIEVGTIIFWYKFAFD
jgi:hypothetical protein